VTYGLQRLTLLQFMYVLYFHGLHLIAIVAVTVHSRNKLLFAQFRDTGEGLSLEQFQARTSSSADVTELIFGTVVGNYGCCVTPTDDHGGAVLGSFNVGIEQILGTLSEVFELEDSSRTIPQNRLGFENGLFVQLSTLGSDVQTQPAIGNSAFIGCRPYLN